MKKLLLCVLMFTLACSPLRAADGPDQKHITKIQNKVAACLKHERRVTVETYDGRLFRGSVSEAGADAFVLSFNGRRTPLKYEEVRKISWPSAAAKQAKVAIEVTAVLGGLLLAVVLLGGLRG
ncbi:MAG: hypothetical protein ABSC10_13315 [Candidatus Acidiferrales bacterium]|jgi:hypothetical protein